MVGVGINVTVGTPVGGVTIVVGVKVGAFTVTVAVASLVPAEFLHVKVKMYVSGTVSGPTGCVPEVAFAPVHPVSTPPAKHESAPSDDQVRVVVPPANKVVGLAVR